MNTSNPARSALKKSLKKRPACQGLLAVAISLSICFQATAALAEDCEVIEAIEEFDALDRAPEGSVCAEFVAMGSSAAVSCYWEFPLRDAASSEFAQLLWDTLKICRNGTQLGMDTPVNHPDSYEARKLIAGERVFGVTLKDKGGENRTLVFLILEESKSR